LLVPEANITVWLYAASQAKASDSDTLSLACDSGFVRRPFYNRTGAPIACVKQIKIGDALVLGYRDGGHVRLLGRFRVGRPDLSIAASPVFGPIPPRWRDEFEKRGYTPDPILKDLVGIFVGECELLSGRVAYKNQNALSRLDPGYSLQATPAPPAQAIRNPTNFSPSGYAPISEECSKCYLKVSDGDIPSLARATEASTSAAAPTFWCELGKLVRRIFT
jgi:hypothetical protein